MVIASKEINLSMHFGERYQEATIELDINNRKADGCIVKSLTYQAIISYKEAKDRQMFEQCIEWRHLDDKHSR